ncbi:MAG: gamma-glutamylcyclotransferase [Candidatus Poribacteria bacterium]|nr:MAG: gamma-glutamylcyclotransferase [Candidatus Poribacteria bacterium]
MSNRADRPELGLLSGLFVYGTLRSGEPAHGMLVPPPVQVLPGEVEGRLFALPEGYPGLLDGTGRVRGELLLYPGGVPLPLLNRVDRFEGYYGPGDPRNLYDRIVVVVLTPRGELSAYAYRYRDAERAQRLGVWIPHGDWARYRRERQI